MRSSGVRFKKRRQGVAQVLSCTTIRLGVVQGLRVEYVDLVEGIIQYPAQPGRVLLRLPALALARLQRCDPTSERLDFQLRFGVSGITGSHRESSLCVGCVAQRTRFLSVARDWATNAPRGRGCFSISFFKNTRCGGGRKGRHLTKAR